MLDTSAASGSESGMVSGGFAGAILVEIVDADQRALGAEALRDGEADAVAGAGDQNHFAAEASR